MFVRWALLFVVSLVALTGMGITYGGRVTGPSLVAIPIIAIVFISASLFAGLLCWNADADPEVTVHRADWLTFWAWVTPMIGIMGTVFGFWSLLTAGGNNVDLHNRIQNGGGVALVGTFLGVLSSVILSAMHRMIEHDALSKK